MSSYGDSVFLGLELDEQYITQAITEYQQQKLAKERATRGNQGAVRNPIASQQRTLTFALDVLRTVVLPKADNGGSFPLANEELCERLRCSEKQAREIKKLLSGAGVLNVYKRQTPPQRRNGVMTPGTVALWSLTPLCVKPRVGYFPPPRPVTERVPYDEAFLTQFADELTHREVNVVLESLLERYPDKQ